MTFSSEIFHVTPLYKNLDMLKLNDIVRTALAIFMKQLHHGALHKV